MNERMLRTLARASVGLRAALVALCALAPACVRDSSPSNPPPSAAPPTDAPAALYTCPMHPSYTSDHPGDCPICNMSLVLQTVAPHASASSVPGHATIELDDRRRQLIGVRTGTVRREKVARELRAAGRVEYDERRLSSINSKLGGWVEELFVRATGDVVKRGDPLFSLYSPELIEAQRNFLLASRSAAHSTAADKSFIDSTVRAARERLLLLDQDLESLQQLETAGEAPHATIFRAKSDGVVVRRNLVQGARVESGADLYQLADLTSVWIVAEFYEYELAALHEGAPARIQVSSQHGELIHGTLAYVYPYLDASSRTVSVRIEAANEDRRLKPGMFATVFVDADLGEQLVIDDGAVLETGERALVFVDLGGGRLEPRKIEVGAHVGDLRVVLGGLSEGERIVTSGNFLVDSESRLQSASMHGWRATTDERAERAR